MNADEYRKLAAVEDRMWYFRALHRHVERELVTGLGERPASILDAGCGTGGLIDRLARAHPAWIWTGVDLSELACDFASSRLIGDSRRAGAPAPTIERGSVEALPFADAAFDAVVSADVLYHVDDDAAAVREFRRVLRPGGVVIANVPAYRWLWSYHDEAVHSRRRYARAGLRDLLAGAGLAVTRTTYWNTLPFPLVVARRKLWPAPAGGSDVRLYAAPVEAAFNAAMALELAWLRGGGSLPFGSSVFAVARKP